MTTTYELSTIAQAIEIGMRLAVGWFRGQPETYNDLTPGVFRRKYLNWRGPQNTERKYLEEFVRAAPALEPNTPAADDLVSWLFLAQHHKLPTRLLDWTQNVLVGLYFATDHQADFGQKDGELWAMDPYELNKLSPTMIDVASPRSEIVRQIVADAFGPENLKADSLLPVAVLPPLAFPRLVSQLSAFTLHPPTDGPGIPGLLPNEFQLVRYVIPARSKWSLRADLARLDVTPRTVFQDLDSLSASIVEETGQMRVQQQPPHW